MTPETVGKAELCEILAWSRPRLDRRLRDDPAFPVLRKGDRSGGWEFRPADVLAYLQGRTSTVRSSSVEHNGEQSAKQRRDALQAAVLAEKLKASRADLVDVAKMRTVLTALLGQIGTSLNDLAAELVKRLELTGDQAVVVREMIADMHRDAADGLRPLLEEAPARLTLATSSENGPAGGTCPPERA